MTLYYYVGSGKKMQKSSVTRCIYLPVDLLSLNSINYINEKPLKMHPDLAVDNDEYQYFLLFSDAEIEKMKKKLQTMKRKCAKLEAKIKMIEEQQSTLK